MEQIVIDDNDTHGEKDFHREVKNLKSEQLLGDWLQALQANQSKIDTKLDLLINQSNKNQEEIFKLEFKVQGIVDNLGLDDKNIPKPGSLLDSYKKFSGVKTGLIWLFMIGIAAMGVYSSAEKLIKRFIGND